MSLRHDDAVKSATHPLRVRRTRIAIAAVAAAAALAVWPLAAGAVTTTTLGAPDPALTTTGTAEQSGPLARADHSTSAEWAYAIPSRGVITQVAFQRGTLTSAGTVQPIALSGATPGVDIFTVAAIGTAVPVASSPARSVVTVATSLAVEAGMTVGLRWNGLDVSFGPYSGNHLYSAADPLNVGAAMNVQIAGVNTMLVQYTLSLAPTVITASTAGTAAPRTGVPQTATTGTWDSQPTDYSYQWQRCDAAGASCTAIAGATTQAYTPVAADIGSTLRVAVQAANAAGISDPSTSAASVVVASAASLTGTTPTFAVTQVGAGSSALVEIRNAGTATARIGTPGITGVAAAAFRVGDIDTCRGTTLGLGGTCSILVEFLPTIAGTVAATLEVPSADDPRSPLLMPLGGTGQVATAPTPPPAARVTFCHREGGPNYVLLTTAPEIVVNAGHPNHAADIIPPFSYLKSGRTITFAGQNWDAEGQAILAAGCVEPSARTELQEPPRATRVTLCHREGGPNYVRITVAPEAAFNGHAKNHELDIIPPFSFTQAGRTVTFVGQNWNSAGQEILENGCRDPEPTEPASPADKVTICHRVGGPQYVRITLAPQGALNGHAKNHDLDIIPPFTHRQGNRVISFPGQNWTLAGRSIWAAGCSDPTPPAQPVTPTVQCVDVAADGSLTAHFGYASANTRTVTIPIGTGNAVAGASAPGQTTAFAPGVVTRAFSVSGVPAGGSAAWTVAYAGVTETATASSATARCQTPTSDDVPLGLIASCSVRSGSTYTAVFGYQSDATATVTIPVGARNHVEISTQPRGPVDRGQITAFAPGRDASSFRVTGIPVGATITWTVDTGLRVRSATASAGDPACAAPVDPVQPPEPKPDPRTEPIGLFVSCVRANGNGTYDAVFGYVNPNPAAVTVPIGLANATAADPAPVGRADLGQTTTFLPGSVDSAWTATWVPAGQALTWTVAYQATTTATATSTAPACADGAPELPAKPEPPDPEQPKPQTTEPTIGVFAQCVTVTGRTYSVTFGYESDGATTAIIAIGARNGFAGGRDDRGQPTEFVPGRVGAAFTLTGIPIGATPEWTVVSPSGASATARATPTGPDCATEPPTTEPELVPDLPPPSQPPTEDRPERRIVEIENPGTTPAVDVVVVVPNGPGYTVTGATSSRSATCTRERGRIVMRVARLLPGEAASCRITIRITSCALAKLQVQSTGRLATGRISAPTGQTRGVDGCRAARPEPVTG